jgi:GYF domain
MEKKRKAKIWEYVIKGENGEQSETYGPFSTTAMNEWQYQGFFNNGNVSVRCVVGPNKKNFREVDDVDFDEEIEKLN